MMIYLDGPMAGHGYEIKHAGAATFLIVDDLEFEVDPSSDYRPAHVDQPVAAILVTDAGLAITSLVKEGNWPDAIKDVFFDDPGNGSKTPTLDEVGYTSWRAKKRTPDGVIEIISFMSTMKGDR